LIKFLAPLFFIFFSIGIFLSKFFSFSFLFFSLLLFIILLYFFLKFKRLFLFDIFSLLVFLILGALLYRINIFCSSAHIKNFLKEKEVIFLKGIVNSDPKKYSKNFTEFLIIPLVLEKENKIIKKIEGNIKAFYWGNLDLNYGDLLILKAKIKKDNLCIIWLKKIGRFFLNPLKYASYRLRKIIEKTFQKEFPSQISGFLNSVLIGKREYLSKKELIIFKNTGTMHLLAISGLHVGVFTGILNFILKFFGLKKKFRYFFLLLSLPFYAVLTGLNPPVLRACILVFFWIISFFLNRPQDLINNLFISALLLLFFKPELLFNISFQFSYICTFFIILFLNTIKFKPPLLYLKNLSLISIVAFLSTLPLVSFYFGIIPFVGIIANIFLTPILFLVMSLSFLFLFLQIFKLGFIIKDSLLFLVELFRLINFFLFKIGGKIDFKFSILGVVFYYSLFLGMIFIFKYSRRKQNTPLILP